MWGFCFFLFFSFPGLFAGTEKRKREIGWCLVVDELTERGRWLLVIVIHAKSQEEREVLCCWLGS